ncbi:MAG: UDP-3-O-(3-hydroxymyristoyl)glucosamine N-acyltransferase [Candidatus Zixiibacteriota bacterium]
MKNNSGIPLAELASATGAELRGDGSVLIERAASIEHAGTGDISFVANPHYSKFIASTSASALVLDPSTPCDRIPTIRHANPYLTFARILDLLYVDEPLVSPGVNATAVVELSADIHPSCSVGPLCHVRPGVQIGSGTRLVSSVFLGDNVTIGKDCLIYPGVKIMAGCHIGNRCILHAGVVVGSDGFGFAPSDTGIKKIKQVGWVDIQDDVEIGANTTIDRGALGPTVIKRGTKIDNLVQIAHNVEVGEHCLLVSQVGVSGSTKLGNGVILAGQVGVVGHIQLGDGVQVGAQSGVANSIAAGETVLGSPARPLHDAKRIYAAIGQLPELVKRVRKIEQKLGD